MSEFEPAYKGDKDNSKTLIDEKNIRYIDGEPIYPDDWRGMYPASYRPIYEYHKENLPATYEKLGEEAFKVYVGELCVKVGEIADDYSSRGWDFHEAVSAIMYPPADSMKMAQWDKIMNDEYPEDEDNEDNDDTN